MTGKATAEMIDGQALISVRVPGLYLFAWVSAMPDRQLIFISKVTDFANDLIHAISVVRLWFWLQSPIY